MRGLSRAALLTVAWLRGLHGRLSRYLGRDVHMDRPRPSVHCSRNRLTHRAPCVSGGCTESCLSTDPRDPVVWQVLVFGQVPYPVRKAVGQDEERHAIEHRVGDAVDEQGRAGPSVATQAPGAPLISACAVAMKAAPVSVCARVKGRPPRRAASIRSAVLPPPGMPKRRWTPACRSAAMMTSAFVNGARYTRG